MKIPKPKFKNVYGNEVRVVGIREIARAIYEKPDNKYKETMIVDIMRKSFYEMQDALLAGNYVDLIGVCSFRPKRRPLKGNWKLKNPNAIRGTALYYRIVMAAALRRAIIEKTRETPCA